MTKNLLNISSTSKHQNERKHTDLLYLNSDIHINITYTHSKHNHDHNQNNRNIRIRIGIMALSGFRILNAALFAILSIISQIIPAFTIIDFEHNLNNIHDIDIIWKFIFFMCSMIIIIGIMGMIGALKDKSYYYHAAHQLLLFVAFIYMFTILIIVMATDHDIHSQISLIIFGFIFIGITLYFAWTFNQFHSMVCK